MTVTPQIPDRRARRINMRKEKSISNRPQVYNLLLKPLKNNDGDSDQYPANILLLRPEPRRPEQSSLFLNRIPVPREKWHYDTKDKVIRWKGIYGGGEVFLSRKERGGLAKVGKPGLRRALRVTSKVSFLCDVALDAGVERATIGTDFASLTWEPTSEKWQSAQWDEDRLLLSYSVTFEPGQVGVLCPIEFEDLKRSLATNPWLPNAYAMVDIVETPDQGNQWSVSFENGSIPLLPGDGYDTQFPESVFPCSLRALEPPGDTINGAMETNGMPGKGILLGIQGEYCNELGSGYFRTSNGKMPFGIFNGDLYLDGNKIGKSFRKGSQLVWSGLTKKQQNSIGLEESGELSFIANGATGKVSQTRTVIRRLSGNSLSNLVGKMQEFLPFLSGELDRSNVQDDSLSSLDLALMTPFIQREGAWVDIVQEGVRNDLSKIMNSYIDPAMWELLFSDKTQPVPEDYWGQIASSPPEAAQWYTSLSTALLSHGLAEGDDEYCSLLNGPRAGSWLTNEVTNSDIFKDHSNQLYDHHWRIKEPNTGDFLVDQYNTDYSLEIDSLTQAAQDDIENNIVETDAAEEDLKDTLKDQVFTLGEYAKEKNLYWAFAYFADLTDVISMTNLAYIIYSTDDEDRSELAREIQKNLSTLTALDNTERFAQEYLMAMNTFLGGNFVMELIDLDDVSEEDFDLVMLYLQEFVNQNITNEDAELQNLAQQLQQMMAEDDFEAYVKDCLNLVGSCSLSVNAYWGMGYICDQFEYQYELKFSNTKWKDWGSKMGGFLLFGISAMSAMNLITAYQNWDDLNAAEKSKVVIDSVQMGAQFMKVLAKLGSKLSDVRRPENFTWRHAQGGYGAFIISTPVLLAEGLYNITRYMAYTLADVVGFVMDGKMMKKLKLGMNDVKNKKWTKKIFGSNFNDFMATRLGPMMALAGIGFSINQMIQGESGLMLAADTMDIMAATLEIFAVVGGWALEGLIAEGFLCTIISAAGVMAIVLAVVGVILRIIFKHTHTPENPIQIFVETYAQPTGFAVTAKSSAIDYAYFYEENGLGMEGATLSMGSQYITCGNDGATSLGPQSALPDVVMAIETDGWGNSKIKTVALYEDETTPIFYALSLMNDGTVTFAPIVSEETNEGEREDSNIKTQVWRSSPVGTASLASNGENLASLSLKFQAVVEGTNGEFTAEGWLVAEGNALAVSPGGQGVEFRLTMSGLGPNYMEMPDIVMAAGPLAQSVVYSPHFGRKPSNPLEFSLLHPSPSFFDFDESTGSLSSNSEDPFSYGPDENTITAASSLGLGADEADFSIVIL